MSVKTKGVLLANVVGTSGERRRLLSCLSTAAVAAAGCCCGRSGVVDLSESFSLDGATCGDNNGHYNGVPA